MKNIMMILITAFVSSTAFAGNGGGTMMGAMTAGDVEIVFNMSTSDSDLKFAHAVLVDKQWQIERVQIPTDFVVNNVALIKALESSKNLKQWVEINKN